MNFTKLNPKSHYGLEVIIIGVFAVGLAYAFFTQQPSAAEIELAKLGAPIKIASMQQKIREAERTHIDAIEDRKVDRKLKCILDLRNAVGRDFVNLRASEFLELVAKTCP